MNCFTFLGLDEDHRTHPVQLVKHRAEVPESKLTFPVYGQVKRDGVFCMLIVTEEASAIFGRTGKAFTNVDVLASKFFGHVLPGVYFGELETTAPAHLEELSGAVNPNRVNLLDFHKQAIIDGLYISFFDYLPIRLFIQGTCDVGFLKRHAALKKRVEQLHLVGLSNVLDITELNSDAEVEAFAQRHIDDDQEGAVFKLDVDYEAGHKGYRQTKIVRGVNYDLTCVGWEEGKGKYKGKVANLLFKWKGGRVIKAMLGKGWTHDDAERMFKEIKGGGELNVVGKIFAVKALQESSKGVLRLPKAGELRHDKEAPDIF